MISIHSLQKSYGSNKVLKGIDLQLEPGVIHGIVGENGAGKTTLFKCIAGLESNEGKIDYAKGNLRNVTGFLPTNPYFLSKITGAEYLQLLCNARNIQIDDMASQNIFELPLKQYADTYSTGMKKKLALTAILMQKNEVFVLDEPFNGVDIHSNIVIKEVLDKLRQLGKIVVLSSHIFSTLDETCDHLHYLKQGLISQSAVRGGFKAIEDQMKLVGISAKIDNLKL
ncbi:MAG: ABC-2 type transport system ATP-binding protein [Flavobacteriales bacterium]|jgi:ABC-2 type transport system ATP-binding protein